MALTQIHIEHVRNLQQVKLQDLQAVNVFFGCNGSGKTSLLEAIHLLGMARSFRGSSIKSLIAHDEPNCTVFGTAAQHPAGAGAGIGVAELEMPSLGLRLGVQRSRTGEAQIKVGGRVVRTVAELAEQFPLQVITSDSFGLLTGAPGARRRYLDWGVFHVEQQFFVQWQRFQRCIKQRNQLLRRGKVSDQELATWTRDLAATGTAVSEYRKSYFQTLAPRFNEIMARLAPSLNALELVYRQGWDKRLTYAEAMKEGLPSDLEQGYTHTGPQRGDIRVTFQGHLAADTLSRGQQKLVVCGLKIAQGQLVSELGGGKCTYLIDDLPSELDQAHSRQVCALLASMGAQVFITCVDHQEIRSVWPEASELAMFHVEHGTVKRYSGS